MIDFDPNEKEDFLFEAGYAPVVILCIALIGFVVWWTMP